MEKIIQKLIDKKDLDEAEIKEIVELIEKNDFVEVQMAALLAAMQSKGVTSDELYYFTENLISKANKVDFEGIDVCGTGGDCKGTFNVSTATAFVVAASGVKVAKHGNRAVSSNCGSFDVLEALGVDLEKENSMIKFMFAPKHHPVFKNIGMLRKNLGIRTIFNIMGPLLNPAKVNMQLIGVYDPDFTDIMARVLLKRGMKGMVVNGEGFDEISITGKTKISEIVDGKINTYQFDPKEYGFRYAELDEILAKDKEESSGIIKGIFEGKKSAARDIVIINSAAALKIAGKADDFKQGIILAEKTIDDGKALELMNNLKC